MCTTYIGWLSCGNTILLVIEITMDEKFDKLMREIRQSRREVEEKIADLKTKVSSTQKKTTQDLAKKIGDSSYQLKRKGNNFKTKPLKLNDYRGNVLCQG